MTVFPLCVSKSLLLIKTSVTGESASGSVLRLGAFIAKSQGLISAGGTKIPLAAQYSQKEIIIMRRKHWIYSNYLANSE